MLASLLRSMVSSCTSCFFFSLETDELPGTSVRVFGTNNIRNDSGVLDPTWDCFVDNISIGPSTPFQYPENNWVFCSQDKLVDGPHILTVNATVAKEQTFWFDDIQYAPSASVSLEDAAVVVDSLDPQLQYGAGWQALGGTANMTTQTNSIFTYDFTGTSRVLFCVQFFNRSIQAYL